MKSRILILSLLLINICANAQWVKQVTRFQTLGLGVQSISIVNPNVVWAVAIDTTGTAPTNWMSRTTNGGTIWGAHTINGANGLDATSITAVNADTAWVSMNDNNNGGGFIYKTTNGGGTWTHQSSAAFANPNGYVDFVYFFDPSNGVAVGDSNGGYWEIYTTTNGGTAWNRVSSGNIPANLIGETGNDNNFAVIGNTLWFTTTSGRVYKSKDKGNTWTVANTGLATAVGIAFPDTAKGLVTDGTGQYKTTDGGLTWSAQAYSGTIFGGSLCSVPGSRGYYVSTGWQGTYGSSYTIDSGATWISIDAAKHGYVTFLNKTTGWSGGFDVDSLVDGIFKWTGTLGVNDISFSDSYKVKVYPNPLSNSGYLEISGNISNLKDIRVIITDLLGNVIADKADIRTNKIGIESDYLNSGLYFYKVMCNKGIIGSGRFEVIK